MEFLDNTVKNKKKRHFVLTAHVTFTVIHLENQSIMHWYLILSLTVKQSNVDANCSHQILLVYYEFNYTFDEMPDIEWVIITRLFT